MPVGRPLRTFALLILSFFVFAAPAGAAVFSNPTPIRHDPSNAHQVNGQLVLDPFPSQIVVALPPGTFATKVRATVHGVSHSQAASLRLAVSPARIPPPPDEGFAGYVPSGSGFAPIMVTRPGAGTDQTLINGACGASISDLTFSFDDAAALQMAPGADPCLSGSCRPNAGTLAGLAGLVNGTWELRASNPDGTQDGAIAGGWTLELDGLVDAGCSGGEPTIVGTDGADVLRGTAKEDVISGLGGEDVLIGHAGSDTICGGAGDDAINGGKAGDRLFGETGNDRLKGAGGPDALRGGPGTDSLKGGPGRDKLIGGPGKDREG